VEVATRLHELKQLSLVDLCGGELCVVGGPDIGLRVPIGPSMMRVGTSPGSHLQLSDPTVSRLHFQLHPRRDGFRLVDAGSTNGTFVDGVRVRDADLLGGATLRIGATVLRLEMGSEPLRVALSKHQSFGSLIGSGVEMRRLYAVLERVAPTDATVLIQGETGTGKELVAREIHQHSGRAAAPFVAVDCGAIAPNVIESELFGHVRGSFSGAVSDRRGLIEEAHSGTLFLDEIGELAPALQVKLLRALETREVRRVGANGSRPVDVRLVAATNRSLASSVNEGSFREDLYYRLAVIEAFLPPLRARREDIPLLAQHFFKYFHGSDAAVPPDLLATLMTRSWPGNVRELKNFIERCVTLGMPGGARSEPGARSPTMEGATTGLSVALDLPLKQARDDAVERFERLYVETALRRADGNVTRAAEHSGVSRRFLQRLIARLGIRGAAAEADELDEGDEDE
jgi:transcriptional regulator with PAS, ATPase and Fis domain